MSARRVARSTRVKPNKVRDREFEEVREVDPDGRIVLRHRTVDRSDHAQSGGTIRPCTTRTRLPGRLHVRQSGPDPRAADAAGAGAGREPELNERQLDARRRVHAALQALGGIGSPAGSCVWHVVGLQRSVREWAMRQGWWAAVDQKEAKGILIAALGILAARPR